MLSDLSSKILILHKFSGAREHDHMLTDRYAVTTHAYFYFKNLQINSGKKSLLHGLSFFICLGMESDHLLMALWTMDNGQWHLKSQKEMVRTGMFKLLLTIVIVSHMRHFNLQ